MASTDNGWFASKTLATRPFLIDGVAFVPGIVDNDDVDLVLRFVMQRIADRVEKPVAGWCWGFGFRPNRNDPSRLSRHSGGIAVDLNAPTNPNGIPTARTWEPWQIAAIHEVLDELDELCGELVGSRVVRWGGDFNGTPDSMHFEINRTPAELRSCAVRLRARVEALMVTEADEKKIRAIVTEVVDARIEAATPAIVDAVLDAQVDDDPDLTIRRAMRRAGKPTTEIVEAIATAVASKLKGA